MVAATRHGQMIPLTQKLQKHMVTWIQTFVKTYNNGQAALHVLHGCCCWEQMCTNPAHWLLPLAMGRGTSFRNNDQAKMAARRAVALRYRDSVPRHREHQRCRCLAHCAATAPPEHPSTGGLQHVPLRGACGVGSRTSVAHRLVRQRYVDTCARHSRPSPMCHATHSATSMCLRPAPAVHATSHRCWWSC
jgi:hypothetical protein